MSKDYINNIPEAERRFFTGGRENGTEVRAEKRAEGDAEVYEVFGYASVFNSVTSVASWFDEEILPGAFDDVLQDDVRALFNHDPNYILARSGGDSPTLTIGVDAKGLWYRFVMPDRTFANDLRDAIEAGDVSQSSFGFTVKTATWIEREGLPDLRQITKIGKLYDVSPVTYPAYADTSVAKRSFDAAVLERKTGPEQNDDYGLSLKRARVNINKNHL